jgi:hypothetical protein
MEPQKGNY